jgi:hypothetical protein
VNKQVATADDKQARDFYRRRSETSPQIFFGVFKTTRCNVLVRDDRFYRYSFHAKPLSVAWDRMTNVIGTIMKKDTIKFTAWNGGLKFNIISTSSTFLIAVQRSPV